MYNAPNIIKDWNREHSGRDNSVFVDRLVIGGLTDEQIVMVLQVLESVCHECWDDDLGCQCWNDE